MEPQRRKLLALVASALRDLGYSASDLRDLGYSASEVAVWDEIPVLEQPYSRMLAEIQAGQRCHDQSTFGPESSPVANACGTPMCTAGHLVHMAGEVGWKLRRKYGFAEAARHIHAKSRPDVPPQNFGSIPQEWAMAYIEERAAEEQARAAPATSV